LCWTSLLIHGNYPNNSRRWRMVQYMRMVPIVGTPYIPLAPEPENYRKIQVTPLGEKLFGIKPWEESTL